MCVELVASEELGVIAEVAQEPAQLPQRFFGAIDPAGKQAADEMLGFEDGKLDGVEGLLGMPAVLRPLDADQIDTIGHLGGLSGLVQAREAVLQATTSFCPR